MYDDGPCIECNEFLVPSVHERGVHGVVKEIVLTQLFD